MGSDGALLATLPQPASFPELPTLPLTSHILADLNYSDKEQCAQNVTQLFVAVSRFTSGAFSVQAVLILCMFCIIVSFSYCLCNFN